MPNWMKYAETLGEMLGRFPRGYVLKKRDTGVWVVGITSMTTGYLTELPLTAHRQPLVCLRMFHEEMDRRQRLEERSDKSYSSKPRQDSFPVGFHFPNPLMQDAPKEWEIEAAITELSRAKEPECESVSKALPAVKRVLGKGNRQRLEVVSSTGSWRGRGKNKAGRKSIPPASESSVASTEPASTTPSPGGPCKSPSMASGATEATSSKDRGGSSLRQHTQSKLRTKRGRKVQSGNSKSRRKDRW